MSSPSETRTTLENAESQPLMTPDDSDAVVSDEQTPLLPSSTPITKKEQSGIRWWTILYWVFISAFLAFLGVLVIMAILTGGGDDGPGDEPFDWDKALKAALGGGLAGATAMILQVLTLMPLRTIMNYQYRFGTTTSVAAKTLYRDGGWKRYYHGLGAALIQGPVSRFGDTAADKGILALMESNPFMRTLPILIQTCFVSLCAAAFRIPLTPIDTVKTTLQAQGKKGWGILRNRVRMYGITSLWNGALAAAGATLIGNYPWFATYEGLTRIIPESETLFWSLCRQALAGFCASVVSDTVSNSPRVVKTYRQVNGTDIGYVNAAKEVIRVDGVLGLFGRGLKTRIISNGLQGLMFSILWKLFLDLWNSHT